MYKYAILDPRNVPAAQAANEAIFAGANAGVLGIEVSIPTLAERTLGNIDPQHQGGYVGLPALDPMWYMNDAAHGDRGGWRFSTAIQLATSCALPRAGVTLATIRPDLDSLGAMAVLSLRAQGQKTPDGVQKDGKFFCPACSGEITNAGFMDTFLECERQGCAWREGTGLVSAEVTQRIWRVAAADNFSRGGWPGPKPFPTKENPWPNEGAADATRSLAAIAAAVADLKVAIADRVALMERWLLTGEEPAGYRERVEAERAEMIAAIESGDIKAQVVSDGKVAVVNSTHRAGTAVGYALAPVAVVYNPAFRVGDGESHLKFTVCQYNGTYVDFRTTLSELQSLEQGWGGSSTLLGSPQGVGSTLTPHKVVEIVTKHLKK